MSESLNPLDPLEAMRPPDPPRPPFRFALAGVGVFLLGSLLSYFLFTVILVLAAPSRNTALGILGVFLLVAGSGTSTTLAIVLYQRLSMRWRERQLPAALGGVFSGDWRSGDGDRPGS
jgi:hypothetical protein